jgi:hypothetical protein
MKSLSAFLLRFCILAMLFAGAMETAWAKSNLKAQPEYTNFGTVELLAVTQATITVFNEVSYPVYITGAEFENDPFNEFRVVSTLPVSVAGYGGSFEVTVEFRPTTSGTKDAELKIRHGSNYEESAHFTAEVTAPVQPELELSTYGLDFGQVALSLTAGRQATIRNTGTTVASVELSIGDDPNGEFVITTATTFVLQPDEALDAGLLFTPSTTGIRTATLLVSMPAPYATTLTVSLTGEGMPRAPKLSVTPDYVNFGVVQLSSSAVQQVYVSNLGTAPATVTFHTEQEPGGEFAVMSTATAVILPNESYNISLSFTPEVVGVRTDNLIISMPYPYTATLIVPLNGQGIDERKPELSVYPSALDFNDVVLSSSAVRQVVVHNTGDLQSSFILQLSDDPNGEFSVTSATTFVLQPDERRTIEVYFTPTITGAHTARLLVELPTPFAATRTVWLYGNGVGVPVVSMTPDTLDFGSISTTSDIQVRTLTIRNTGTADAPLQMEFPTGSIFEPDGSVPSVVRMGRDARISVVFRPQQEGRYEVEAMVRAGDASFPVVLIGEYKRPVQPPQLAIVHVPEITANIGQQFVVPFVLDAVTSGISYEAVACRITLRFNASLMVPVNSVASVDSTAGGFRTLTVSTPVSWLAPGNTLLTLPMIAALGDAEATVIELLDVEWLDGAGNVLTAQTQTRNGRLIIGDIWRQGGVRLVNPNSGDLYMTMSPNPARSDVSFRLLYKSAAKLDIYDVMGNQVLSLTTSLPGPGTSPVSVEADISQLPLGIYYCRLSAGKFSLVRTLRIE